MANVGLRAVKGGRSEVVGPAGSAMKYDIGVTRLFGDADIGTQGLREGWSHSEESHNWNDGLDSTLTLWTDDVPNAPCLLSVEGSPYLAKGVGEQRIVLFVNGYRLGFWSLTEDRTYALKVVIEPEQWLHRDGGGLLKIVWHMPDSVKPIDVGAAEDHRKLGFCFRTLTLDAHGE